MGDQSFGKDFIVQSSSGASNTIVNSTDLSANCASTTKQLQDYLDIASTSSNDVVIVDKANAEASNDLSSDNIQKLKIWSISDILGNSSDKCSNEISSTPSGEISYDIQNCVPVHSNTELNPTVARNNMIYSNNTDLNANYFTENQSQLNMRNKPYIKSGITSFMPTTESNIPTDVKEGEYREWMMRNGIECSYEVLNYGHCRWYLCGTCCLCFNDEETLYRHQFDAHVSAEDKKNYAYQCPFCSTDCLTNLHLYQHQRKWHPYSCFFCQIQFSNQTQITYHFILCHPNLSMV